MKFKNIIMININLSFYIKIQIKIKTTFLQILLFKILSSLLSLLQTSISKIKVHPEDIHPKSTLVRA